MEDAAGNDLMRAFDSMAPRYDATYLDNPSMRLMRSRVRAHLTGSLEPGDRILDLGCGTGEDALFLARAGYRVVGADFSPEMVRIARQKAAEEGLGERTEFRRLDITSLAEELPGDDSAFDAVLSDFGGLNTIPDLSILDRPVSRLLKPGGRFVACVMGRHCVWDWLTEIAHLRIDEARNRRRNGTVVRVKGYAVRTYFPTPREFTRAFGSLRPVHVQALALFVPPPRIMAGRGHLDPLWQALDAIEQPFARLPLLAGAGDHFLAVLEKP